MKKVGYKLKDFPPVQDVEAEIIATLDPHKMSDWLKYQSLRRYVHAPFPPPLSSRSLFLPRSFLPSFLTPLLLLFHSDTSKVLDCRLILGIYTTQDPKWNSWNSQWDSKRFTPETHPFGNVHTVALQIGTYSSALPLSLFLPPYKKGIKKQN
jgi:hypothetical protein